MFGAGNETATRLGIDEPASIEIIGRLACPRDSRSSIVGTARMCRAVLAAAVRRRDVVQT